MPLIYDVETNGLLDKADTIHSLVIQDTSTDKMWSCCDHLAYESPRPGVDTSLNVRQGVELLLDSVRDGRRIAGHNIICFDNPAVDKVFPTFEIPIEQVRDTLNISRLIWPEIKEQLDFSLTRKGKIKPGPWMGRHSLGAWGTRLEQPKDDYAQQMEAKGLDPWAQWTPEMQTYCEQDVLTNRALWDVIEAKQYDERSILLEMMFQNVMFRQEQFGFPFDVREAERLYAELAGRRAELEENLQTIFKPWYKPVQEFTPKANNKRYHYIAGATMTKVALNLFNPSSRQQIADRLQKIREWDPIEFSPTGQPIVSETVLETLYREKGWDECHLLAEYLMLQKRIGQLAEGKHAWLKLEQNGRIHGRIITNGAVTGRCTHREPNVAQTPRVSSPYGREFRSLFYAPKGWEVLGCDASGLELRMLAHYMARYDGGEYARIVLEGDIHTANQEAAGLDVRDQAKTFIYAFLYGAGPIKIGSIVKPLAHEDEQKKIGIRLTNRFLNRTPALKRLREQVKDTVKSRGYLVGLDGRRLHIRSQHAALNTLFQSAGAVVMKKATVLFHQYLLDAGYSWGNDFGFAANVHDEYQVLIREGIRDDVGPMAVSAIKDSGRHFGLRIPLDGEYKVGKNWAETH